ncbi:DUF4170 domain-containing protein [Salaquimonas pukyongi]|uniref:DUF4170 domain-containing protein n=1 Tax=Salaquimonas pukyongi TaxID=2712698 RepID=UPI00096BBBB9|nr:DUF4170 domain-containing protein [Salaquimonas pukyongi]
MTSEDKNKPVEKDGQLLHLVFGGELNELQGVTFRDLDKVDIVGLFPDYRSAHQAWKAKAQQTVDNAHMRYFIVHLHKILDPDGDGKYG